MEAALGALDVLDALAALGLDVLSGGVAQGSEGVAGGVLGEGGGLAPRAAVSAQRGEGFGDAGEQVPQTWIVGDVDHCVAELKQFIETFGITDIVSMAVPPGMRAEQMSASLERLFTQVVPRLKAELAATAT